MISFPSREIDENELYKQAHNSFLKYARNLLAEGQPYFEDFFDKYKLENLNTVLTKVQYTKYIHDQDLIYFDQSTSFHYEVNLHVYAIDQDGDEETLAGYLLVLNSEFEPVDDFLR